MDPIKTLNCQGIKREAGGGRKMSIRAVHVE
jgi:hypothetical protein